MKEYSSSISSSNESSSLASDNSPGEDVIFQNPQPLLSGIREEECEEDDLIAKSAQKTIKN